MTSEVNKNSREFLSEKIQDWLIDFYQIKKYGSVEHLQKKMKAVLNQNLYAEEYQKHIIYILEKYAGKLEQKKILNVGCGSGGMEVALSRKGAKPVGLDIDSISIEIAELRKSICSSDQIEYVVGDGTHINFKDNCFDLVLSTGVFEHIPVARQKSFLMEQMRVLKPGGYILIGCSPNKWFPYDMHFELPFVNWMPGFLKYHYIKIFRPYYIHRIATTNNTSFKLINNIIGNNIDRSYKCYIDIMKYNINILPVKDKQPTDKLMYNINVISERFHLNSIIIIIAKILSRLSMEMSIWVIARKNRV